MLCAKITLAMVPANVASKAPLNVKRTFCTFAAMKDKFFYIIGKIMPTLVLILLTPVSVVLGSLVWLFQTIRKIFQREI